MRKIVDGIVQDVKSGMETIKAYVTKAEKKAIVEQKDKSGNSVPEKDIEKKKQREIYDVQSRTDSTYGKKLIKFASIKLTEEFGKGFDERNLRNMRQFYETFQMWNAVRSELSWTHYRLLMRIKESEKREYYMKECIDCAWSAR